MSSHGFPNWDICIQFGQKSLELRSRRARAWHKDFVYQIVDRRYYISLKNRPKILFICEPQNSHNLPLEKPVWNSLSQLHCVFMIR